MVSQTVQTKLVIQAVSRGFKDVDKQLDSINKRLGKTEQAAQKGGKGVSALGSAFGGLGSVLATLGLGLTIKQLGEFAFESTMLAARVETLGVVTQTLGKNAGYTSQEIIELERSIQKQGITTQASRQSLALMMQAQLDLADSTDLARMAQDAAVIAGVNSSEAFQRLINVITTGNVRMARTMGLQVNFNQGYEDLAERLGITADELTATEKAQERVNIVMNEGTQIANAYTNAMETVGKQVMSTPRYWEEYKKSVGQANVGLLGFVNRGIQQWLNKATVKLDLQNAQKEAFEKGLIVGQDMLDLDIALADEEITHAEALEYLTDQLDEYNIKQERAIELEEFGMRNKQNSTGIVEEFTGAVTASWKEIEKFSKVSIGWQVLDKMLQGFQSTTSQDGLLISDNEQQALRNTAEIYGITLPAALDVFIESAGNAQQAALNLAGDYYASFDFGINFDTSAPKSRTTYTPPGGGGGGGGGRGGGEQEYARGGVLGGGVSMVGEQGWEFIIGNTVIPHGMSKDLARMGLRAGKAFGLGGTMDVNVPGNWLTDSMDYGYGVADYVLANKFARDPLGGTNPIGDISLPNGGGGAMEVNNTLTALSGAVTTSTMVSAAQSQLVAEKISTTMTREISRGNKEVADLMRINNALLARLATAEEIVSGVSSSMGDLM